MKHLSRCLAISDISNSTNIFKFFVLITALVYFKTDCQLVLMFINCVAIQFLNFLSFCNVTQNKTFPAIAVVHYLYTVTHRLFCLVLVICVCWCWLPVIKGSLMKPVIAVCCVRRCAQTGAQLVIERSCANRC